MNFFHSHRHLIFSLMLLLVLAGCAPPKQQSKPQRSAEARLLDNLQSNNPNAIQQQLRAVDINADTRRIIGLYNLLLRDRHHQIVEQSTPLLQNFDRLTAQQQYVAREIISWAFLRKIYRQETAKLVRIYQHEELLVAPSEIDFDACKEQRKNCAHALRQRISPLIDPDRLNAMLLEMAGKDPCINLSSENRAGAFASNCLATRKGNMKLVLLEPPEFTRSQWQAIL